MTKSLHILVSAILVLLGAHLAQAQVKNEDLAMKIVSARKHNAVLMKAYSWNCRTELIEKEKVLDIRLESVTAGPDGKLLRTIINDDGAPLPRGFLRRHIAEHRKKEVEKYLTGLRELLDKYTLPSAGKVLDFVSTAKTDGAKATGGGAVLKLTGTGVVDPGDSLVMEVDPASARLGKMEITTTFEGSTVTLTATFKTDKAGLTYLDFADIEVPDKEMSVHVHNYEFTKGD